MIEIDLKEKLMVSMMIKSETPSELFLKSHETLKRPNLKRLRKKSKNEDETFMNDINNIRKAIKQNLDSINSNMNNER